MKTLLRYWNTLKYLKPIQIYGRIGFRLFRPKPPSIKSARLRQHERVIGPGAWRTSSLTAPSTFNILGQTMAVADSASWNNTRQSKLLLFNIHYFDDLNATPPEVQLDTHAALIDRWIDENPAPFGNGWEPYPLSLRIVNWTKFLSRIDNPKASWLDSLYQQSLFLSKRIEHHIQGNHLFVNAKALLFAGAYFDGAEADALRLTAQTLVLKELEIQVLDDGGNFELSPMYHSIFLEDILDILSLCLCYPALFSLDFTQRLKKCAQEMLVWLSHMIHPDGDIAFFNDATVGIAPTYQALNDYAERLGIQHSRHEDPLWQGASTGYIVYKASDVYCAMDVGEIGPSYLTAHSHADTLSFELSLHQQRVLVNSGISEYGGSEERLRQRGTDSHNTVCVDAANSSHVWSGFRVAQRASIINKSVQTHESNGFQAVISAAHDGYKHNSFMGHAKGCVHRRTWHITHTRMEIRDELQGNYTSAVAHYLVHPDVSIQLQDNTAHLTLPSGDTVTITVKTGTARVVESTWHPAFSTVINTRKLCIEQCDNAICIHIDWTAGTAQ